MELEKKGKNQGLFVDEDFPADESALFSDRSTPLVHLKDSITWRRPQDICQSPALFPEDYSLGHAKQGLLGDCWLLCACTHLLQNKHLLNKVIPPDQPLWGESGYKGVFQFCFWQNGHWIDVVIDDFLPCIHFKLCFSQCLSPNAFWVALLEKAYAKLHGSYERLWAGQVSEAFVDLTGGLAERWSLTNCGSEKEKHDTGIVRKRTSGSSLLKSVKDNCVLSCSTHNGPTGEGTTQQGQYHALNVLEWLEVSNVFGHEVHLLRIRNPWGRCCWDGSWVKGGQGWSSLDPSCAMDLQARISEGEFWLDEEEFVSVYDDITAGYEIDVNGHIKSIYSGNILTHSRQVAGQWIKEYSAGGSRNSNSYTMNPKYWLKVGEKGEVLVSLLQHRGKKITTKPMHMPFENPRKKHHQFYQAIALHIWKVEKRRFNLSQVLNKAPITSTHCHAYDREVVLCQELESGYYLVIPSTYQPETEAHYLIRVFSSSSISISEIKNPALSLPQTVAGEWEDTFFHGAWVKGNTAGGSRNFQSHWSNPHFMFSVSEDPIKTPGVNIKISLHQSHLRNELHPIGFHIYKINDGVINLKFPQADEPVASCIPHCYNQVVSLSCHLSPGDYSIVPSTFEPDCLGEFTLCISQRVHRKVVKCQETLGRTIQEVSYISLMQN